MLWFLKHLVLYPIHSCLINHVLWNRSPLLKSKPSRLNSKGWLNRATRHMLLRLFPMFPGLLSYLQTCSLSQFSNYISKYIHRGDISSEYLFALTFFYSRLNELGQATPHEDNNDEQDFLQSTPQPVCRQPLKKTRWGHTQIFAKSTFNWISGQAKISSTRCKGFLSWSWSWRLFSNNILMHKWDANKQTKKKYTFV